MVLEEISALGRTIGPSSNDWSIKKTGDSLSTGVISARFSFEMKIWCFFILLSFFYESQDMGVVLNRPVSYNHWITSNILSSFTRHN